MLLIQCIDDMPIRDAADQSFMLCVLIMLCTTHTKQRHQNALNTFKECNINNQDENKLINDPVQPMCLKTLVTTDLIGITRDHSVPTSDIEKYYKIGYRWVPADSALTLQDIIADSNPCGLHGDLHLLTDINSRVRINIGSTPLD